MNKVEIAGVVIIKGCSGPMVGELYIKISSFKLNPALDEWFCLLILMPPAGG